ncbi:triose-phosphate isomerase [Alkalilimnicola ehrlichii]|uniref:Triosephosphate isomerase n=1 Tax=Alkalilimnicola ehrlichii TaxID=351052 RepID=A0A3E0X1T5_9GAMM|nr:triose-phosphate isomerase [Alkalilimnicola ehrlichii]RFA30567.1 triose-phosphate isomerase [Alkalilimnicola ehrlichii]RFA38117.1 triose-phosphate isomerase [Alkalilimnicola ehrlichii]
MRQPLVAGNWKMNGSRAFAGELVTALREGVSALDRVEAVLCPSFVLLPLVAELVGGSTLQVGSQTLSEHDEGAYTGEVSGAMLLDFGCRYAIVGHSERREYYAETDRQIAAKFAAAQRHGLTPILCVGETLQQREREETESVIREQLEVVLAHVGVAAFQKAVVAYEPVWAIGTGKTATPEQAQAVHAFIRHVVAERDSEVAEQLRILYGGSMKAANAAGLLAKADIDGGLIGGASLKAEEFLSICRQASEVKAG